MNYMRSCLKKIEESRSGTGLKCVLRRRLRQGHTQGYGVISLRVSSQDTLVNDILSKNKKVKRQGGRDGSAIKNTCPRQPP